MWVFLGCLYIIVDNWRLPFCVVLVNCCIFLRWHDAECWVCCLGGGVRSDWDADAWADQIWLNMIKQGARRVRYCYLSKSITMPLHLWHQHILDNIYVHYLDTILSITGRFIDNRKGTKIISCFELDSSHKKACPCGGPLRRREKKPLTTASSGHMFCASH